jgi:hypothetical protein
MLSAHLLTSLLFQQFLLRQQQYLQQGTTPPPVGAGMTSVQKTPDRKNVGSPGVQGSPKKVGPPFTAVVVVLSVKNYPSICLLPSISLLPFSCYSPTRSGDQA